jgi:hypothetical protein
VFLDRVPGKTFNGFVSGGTRPFGDIRADLKAGNLKLEKRREVRDRQKG